MIVGMDMGGTNIDGALIDQGKILNQVKQAVDRTDLFGTIWSCLMALLEGTDPQAIERIHLSTTISTNAIVEDQTAKVGLVLQTGPGLVWPYDSLTPEVHYLPGATDHRGKVTDPLPKAALETLAKDLPHEKPEALAICCKFSTRNPETENRIQEYLQGKIPFISLGHRMSGKLNFPRRVQTAYLNAAVSPTFANFAKAFQEALAAKGIQAPVAILKADGGTLALDQAVEKPVESILSGPAASFMGSEALFGPTDQDLILLDVGGTTTDIFFLVDGVPVFEPKGIEIAGHKTLVRAIFSRSIGLGGDSYVRAEEGVLKIGPRRLGPAIVFGGDQLTPTDALAYLGKLGDHWASASPGSQEAGGAGQKETLREYLPKIEEKLVELNKALALDQTPQALAEQILHTFSKLLRDTLDGLIEELSSHPVYTIRELLTDRTLIPVGIRLLGGPAQALKPYLEEALGLPVEVPERFEVANAVGAALARPTAEIHLLADTQQGWCLIPELDFRQKIGKSFNLDQAKDLALTKVRDLGEAMGLGAEELEAELTEAESFNMIEDYGPIFRNIRVQAQIRPGLRKGGQ